jgi:GNAT superfamily N-acetyltransferase
MKLSFIAVTTDQQFRDLLIVRNECRDGLTHDKHEITLTEQAVWKYGCWPGEQQGDDVYTLKYYGPKTEWYEPYLLYDQDYPVGYGLLKWDGQKYWMTIGVAKGYRGNRLSKVLTEFITTMGEREGQEVWLDCMEDNPAYNSYVRAGYKDVDVVVMDTTNFHKMKHENSSNSSNLHV